MRRLPLYLTLLLTATAFINASEIENFKFIKRAVRAEATTKGDISIIPLDAQMYNSIRDLYSGFRIFTPDKTEVPFLVQKATSMKSRISSLPVKSKVISLRRFNNSIEIIVQRTEALPVDRIKLVTPNKNFEKTVDIYASDDTTDWQPIVKGKSIFDYSAITKLSRKFCSFPKTDFNYFKLVINNFTEQQKLPLYQIIEKSGKANAYTKTRVTKRSQSLKINQIILENAIETLQPDTPVTTRYNLKVNSISSESHITTINFSSMREPLNRLELSSSSVNFSRRVNLFGSDDNKNWRQLAGNTYSIINLKNTRQKHNILKFNESRYLYYQLIITNGDNAPLKDLEVQAWGAVYQAVMLGIQPRDLLVVYGGSGLKHRPHYDIKTVLAQIHRPVAVNYQLSPQSRSPFYSEAQGPQDYNYIFYIAITLMTIILAVIAVVCLKKIYTNTPSANQ